jgi:hypothetical protein
MQAFCHKPEETLKLQTAKKERLRRRFTALGESYFALSAPLCQSRVEFLRGGVGI